MPNAARGWGKHRDNFILNHFNKDGWECHRCLSDPCLFVIDRIKPIPKQKDSSTNEKKRTSIRSWVLIHTDDCDAYGKDMDVLHEINDIMNEEWATEIVDSSFVLGVKRERGHDADGKRYCKMSMTSFISDLYSAFQEEYKEAFPKKKTYKTAFPENIKQVYRSRRRRSQEKHRSRISKTHRISAMGGKTCVPSMCLWLQPTMQTHVCPNRSRLALCPTHAGVHVPGKRNGDQTLRNDFKPLRIRRCFQQGRSC